MLRYVYFIDPTARDRLTVPIIPFSKIDEIGAGMYKGEKRNRVGTDEDMRRRCCSDTDSSQDSEGGAIPTSAHHFPEV